jgi:DNA-binding MarR family transcriptional regulator
MTKLPEAGGSVKPLTNPLAGRPRPIGDIMREAHKRLVNYLDRALRDAGWADVAAAHASVLATVDPGGSRLATLVERGGRTKQATAELAGHLLERGYLSLRPDPDDGRAKLYLPTARGYRLLASCTRIVDDYEKWLDGVLGGDGVASLRRALIAIVEHGD